MLDMIPPNQHPNEIDVQLEPLPYTAAAAAKFERPLMDDLERTLEQCSTSLNDSGPVMTEKVFLKGTHPLLGMEIIPDKDNPPECTSKAATQTHRCPRSHDGVANSKEPTSEASMTSPSTQSKISKALSKHNVN
jgi:hypothetical protein